MQREIPTKAALLGSSESVSVSITTSPDSSDDFIQESKSSTFSIVIYFEVSIFSCFSTLIDFLLLGSP